MRLNGFLVPASLCLIFAVLRAADATAPVSYTDRNTAFAPGATTSPDAQKPTVNRAVQDQRVSPDIIDKKSAAIGDRQAAIDVRESHPKDVREPKHRKPDAIAEPMSALNHREADISTVANTSKPPLVTKYQDSLNAASASNMARFAPLDLSTASRINRFVFRKNPADKSVMSDSTRVTPAAGGETVRQP